jgi:excisionase family DNA binding protein
MIGTLEAARRLAVSAPTVRRWAAAGKLPFTKVGSFRAFAWQQIKFARRRRKHNDQHK